MSNELRDECSSLEVFTDFMGISMKLEDKDIEALLGWYEECMSHETWKQ